MRYSVDEIKRDIRIALDQNMSSEQLFSTGDIDTLSLEQIIESKIADAARLVEGSAPIHLLDGGKPFSDSVCWDSAHGYGSGRIHLPDDFLRLVSFQMSDWDRPVFHALTEDTPQYTLQKSRYPGIKGNPQKPVVAITTQPIGQVLEFYTCTGGDSVHVKRARYIPIRRIVNSEIELCEKLKSAIVYRTASLVAMSTGLAEEAGILLNISNELMK